MLKFRQMINRLVSITVSIVLALAPLGSLYAQTQDSEAPVLIHRQIDAGVAGELQTFLARVSDDFGVQEVTLFYRQSDSGEFSSLAMRPLVDSIGEYMIAIETAASQYPGLQYYMEAVDTSGNKTNRGFAYAPIVLPLTAPALATTNTTPGPIIEPRIPAEPVTEKDSSGLSPTTILLGVGALLALGALAGSGGSGGSEPSNPPGGPNTVTLTIISDLP